MTRRDRDEEDGFKRSLGVKYDQVAGSQIEDERFQRMRAVRAPNVASASSHTPATDTTESNTQSATMDAFMRMMTGKEERRISDHISDPSRPTWEQYKKENADKLDLNDVGEKQMREYRKKLDAARERALSGREKKKSSRKKKRRHRSSSSDDSDDSTEHKRSSRKKHRRKKKHKRRRSDSTSESEDSSEDKSHKHRRKSKSKHKDKDKESSPVRLSSFFNAGSDKDDE